MSLEILFKVSALDFQEKFNLVTLSKFLRSCKIYFTHDLFGGCLYYVWFYLFYIKWIEETGFARSIYLRMKREWDPQVVADMLSWRLMTTKKIFSWIYRYVLEIFWSNHSTTVQHYTKWVMVITIIILSIYLFFEQIYTEHLPYI